MLISTSTLSTISSCKKGDANRITAICTIGCEWHVDFMPGGAGNAWHVGATWKRVNFVPRICALPTYSPLWASAVMDNTAIEPCERCAQGKVIEPVIFHVERMIPLLYGVCVVPSTIFPLWCTSLNVQSMFTLFEKRVIPAKEM